MQDVIGGKPDLILASASSRRHQLLKLMNIHYDADVPNVDETVIEQESALVYATRIASLKAKVIWEKKSRSIPVLAADTTISLDGEILGKPNNQEEAHAYLQSLSGCEHHVLTALSLYTNTKIIKNHSISTVKFKRLSEKEISAYSSTKEPLDKAGAYAIQGYAARFIEYFNGSYTGVMGLPLNELGKMLTQIEI